MSHSFERLDLSPLADGILRASGAEHLTILALFDGAKQARRLYSSLPGVFPLDGTKRIDDGPLRDKLLGRAEPELTEGNTAIRAAFYDHAEIIGAGITALLNIPVTENGQVIGTVNCLYCQKPPPVDIAAAAARVRNCLMADR